MTALASLDRHAVAASPRLPVPRRWRIGPAALLSLGLHVVVIGVVVLWARHRVPVALVPENNPATVQLVMSPPGGVPSPSAAPQPKAPPAPKTPNTVAAVPKPLPAAPKTDQPAPSAVAAAPPPSPPAPQATEKKMTFDFADAESDTNAWVTGDLVVPASPDVKFRNRKPSYPPTAAMLGEQGAVILMIHVSPEGLVSSVDVVRSSGFAALDRAARDAVVTWHFMPSVKDGQAVPDDVPMRIVFALN